MNPSLALVLLSQPAATAMGGGSAGPAGSCAQGAGSQLVMMLVLIVGMYFLLIRPQSQQEKAHRTLLSKLKVGDVVRTDSGIKGELVKLTEHDVELLIAERTRITIHRRRIAGLDAPVATEGKKE